MGVYAVSADPNTTPLSTRASWRLAGFAVALVAAGLAALGTFWDLTDNDSGSPGGWNDYWPALIFIVVIAWLVFGLAFRTANAMNASDRALGLVVLGGITLGAFWTGAPTILVLGGIACLVRAERPLTRQDGVTCFLAGIAMTVAVWLAIAG